ncbi:MAG: hypothetical protein GY859_37540 [Desulfobacterales bacterium]|nr:hypothetical protein [Desulfobacterales bacterium]
MIPSFFTTLEAISLAPGGKDDRDGTPGQDPDGAREREFMTPRDEVAETPARIWSEAPGVADMGEGDNFFHIGGHSPLATRVVSRMRSQEDRDEKGELPPERFIPPASTA